MASHSSMQAPLRGISPVIADAARHYAEIDHMEARAEELERRAGEYMTTIHGRNTLTDDAEVQNKLDMFLACLCASQIEGSVQVAAVELKRAMADAAARHAAGDMAREEEDAQVAAWEARQERCEAWA